MSEELQVEREVALDVSADEVWDLVASASGWREWLVDEAAVEIERGSEGDVVDDGVRRHVRIDEVVNGERVSFRWWEGDDPSSQSEVVIHVSPCPDGGSLLRVLERPLTVSTSAVRGEIWDRRLLLLALSFIALARV